MVVDAGDLTVVPAFADSHEHLIEASRNTLLVPVDKARSVADFTGMVADAARAAAPGKWLLTSIAWHESNLSENRLPTLAELDAAALAAAATRPVNSATDRALPTGTSSVLRLASIRCSWESANAGTTVRSPASTTAVSRPARSSSPSGSADTATISGPRRPTER